VFRECPIARPEPSTLTSATATRTPPTTVTLDTVDLVAGWPSGGCRGRVTARPCWLHPGDVVEVIGVIPGILDTLTTRTAHP
jgi:hypothetical protein